MTEIHSLDWRSFTEFFEGEGAVLVRLARAKNSRVLQICFVIGQKWRPKLEQLECFLRSAGIDAGRIYKQKYGYTLRVYRISAVSAILVSMLPFAYLKRDQISAAVQYLHGRVTGDELIAVFNQEFDLGKRRIRPPSVLAPFSKDDLRAPSIKGLLAARAAAPAR